LHAPGGTTNQDIADVLNELTEGTATRSGSLDDPDILNTEQYAHPPWEPPSGATPAPAEFASPEERAQWLNERFQMHVDAAIARLEVEGLTPNQARDVGQVVESGIERFDRLERSRALGDTRPARDQTADEQNAGVPAPTVEEAAVDATADPRRYNMRRGSRIDQFAKESIARDPELAAVITAPDGVPEPDLLDSIFTDWYDITTPAAWEKHFFKYSPTHGWARRTDEGRFPGHIDTTRR
jgi:hypothetical protein